MRHTQTQRPRTRQPQGSARVNRASPLKRGLELAWVPSFGTFNPANPARPMVFGGTRDVVGFSVGGDHQTISNLANTITWAVPSGLTEATILVCFITDQTSQTYVPFKTNATEIDYAPYTSGLSYFNTFASTRYVVGVAVPGEIYPQIRPYVVACRGASRGTSEDFAAFVNGYKAGSTSSTFTLDASVQFFADGGAFSSQRNYLAAFWSRALDDEEIYSLSDNPWQIFAPVRRQLWLPTQVAPVLSAATVTSITATTATPRVTVTFS